MYRIWRKWYIDGREVSADFHTQDTDKVTLPYAYCFPVPFTGIALHQSSRLDLKVEAEWIKDE